ncbi:MAG: hypothetical protein QOI93_5686, partial [Rhodospirillaceae bacterium]|nr:hypothetical protein [Rhodospirillaceae bacterium]
EQRRGGSILAPSHGTLKNILKHTNVDHAI